MRLFCFGVGGVEAGFIPPLEAIERIEVIRGPMSTLYGSDAMGGVINIITRKSTDRWRFSLGLDHTFQEDSRSGDITTGNFFLSGPLYKDKVALQLMGSANLREEDEIISGYNENDNKSITAKLFFTPVEKHEFSLEAGRNVQKREYNPGKSVETTYSPSKVNHERNHWAVGWNANWDAAKSKFNIQQEETKRVTKGNDRKPTITNTVVDAITTIPLPRNMLSIGGQFQYSELEDTNVEADGSGGARTVKTSIDADQYAIFLEDEFFILDNLALTVGIRMDDHEHFGDHWSPRAYLVWHPHRDFTIKGGASKAFKAPGLRELDSSYGYSTGRGYGIMYGDPNLKPETSVTEEIAFLYHNAKGIHASLTVFNTDFDNKLANYNTGQIDPLTGLELYRHTNIGKARIRGVETSFTLPFMEVFKLNLNYTYLDSERRSDEEKFSDGTSTKGQPLTMTPEHSANAKLDWQATEALSLYARVEYTGEQIFANIRSGYPGARKRSEYTTFDLGGSYMINENVRISFAALNLTDEREEDLASLSGTSDWDVVEDGRRYWVGMTFSF